jgi:hypothetical protein
MPETELVHLIAPYTQKVFPRAGHGKLQGTDVTMQGRFPLALRSVTEREARPVATLPFEHGAPIVLREHEDRLYRPVLSPGSFVPIDLVGFVEASSGMEAWRDYPFRKAHSYSNHDTNTGPRPHLERAFEDAQPDWRRLGENDIEAVGERLAARMADMLLVDGVVHVACEQPRLLLKTRKAPGGKDVELALTWSLPGLEGDDHPLLGPSVLEAPNEFEAKQKNPTLKRLSHEGQEWRWFGLSEGPDARRFGATIARLNGIPFAGGPEVVVHDPRAVSPHPGPDPRKSAKSVLSRVGSGLERRTRREVEAWLDARDALEAGNHDACMTGLAEALGLSDPDAAPSKALEWKSSALSHSIYDAGPLLVRYVTVEGRNAPTVEETEEDVLSLGALARAR